MTFVQDDGCMPLPIGTMILSAVMKGCAFLFLELGVEANMPVIIKYPSRYEGKVRSIIELDNKTIWSQNLLDAMTAYGEYSKIPEPEKAVILKLRILNPIPIPRFSY